MFTCFRVFRHLLNLLLRAAWFLKEFEHSVELLQNDHLGWGTEEIDRSGEVAIMGTWGCYVTFFREYNMSVFVLSSCLLCPVIMVILLYLIYTQKA